MAIIRRVMHIPLESMNTQNTGYVHAKARFDEILSTRLGVSASTENTELSPLSNSAAASMEDLSLTAKPSLEQVRSDVRTGSGDSLNQIDAVLQGTPMAGLGAAFKAAENTYGVNAYFLSALAAHESDFGRSAIAKDKQNLFGFTAYDSNPYSNAKNYSSVEESIFDAASYLSQEYLTPGGKHFKGYAIGDIGKSYATDPNWADKVTKHLSQQINPTTTP
mgnify:CR=1 FL=1